MGVHTAASTSLAPGIHYIKILLSVRVTGNVNALHYGSDFQPIET